MSNAHHCNGLHAQPQDTHPIAEWSAGRSDLVHSINRCGGSKRLAAVLGLRYAETRGRKAQSAGAAEALPVYSTASERRLSHASQQNIDFIWV